jgi:hypothetical protein
MSAADAKLFLMGINLKAVKNAKILTVMGAM